MKNKYIKNGESSFYFLLFLYMKRYFENCELPVNKLSTYIIKSHDIICIEDLNTKGLLHNHKLAKSIADVSWASFVNKLEYKAKWYGKELIKIDRLYPSSQICSVCGHRDGKKTLDIREWTCPICHTHHDRDMNASKNILAEGLRIRQVV